MPEPMPAPPPEPAAPPPEPAAPPPEPAAPPPEPAAPPPEQVATARPVAGRTAILAALRRSPPERQEVVAALALVPGLRAELDELERALMDTARECGANWTEIARALGLRTRQAAEQRRLRLAGPGTPRDAGEARKIRQRQRIVDKAAGERVIAVRLAARQLASAIGTADDWPSRGVPALARQTLAIALDAPPGALVDLVRLAVADLSASPDTLAGRPAVAACVRALDSLLPA